MPVAMRWLPLGGVMSVYQAPRHALAAAKWVQRFKRVYDRRSWMKDVRRRALKKTFQDLGHLINDRAGEFADDFAAVLDVEELPGEYGGGSVRRARHWWREKVAWGTRLPEWRAADADDFYSRFEDWVRQAGDSGKGMATLERAGIDVRNDHTKVDLFAQAVTNNMQNLILYRADNMAHEPYRIEMANALHRPEHFAEARMRTEKLRISLITLLTGVGAGATAQQFMGTWVLTLAVAAAVALATAIGVRAMVRRQAHPRLSVQQESVRRQAEHWLATLPCQIRSEPTRRRLANERGDAPQPPRDGLQDAAPFEDRSIHIGHSQDEQVKQLQFLWPVLQEPGGRLVDTQASSEIFDGLDLIRTHAEKAGDKELTACLVDLETALRFAPRMFFGTVEALLVCAQASSVAHNAAGWSGVGDLAQVQHVETRYARALERGATGARRPKP